MSCEPARGMREEKQQKEQGFGVVSKFARNLLIIRTNNTVMELAMKFVYIFPNWASGLAHIQ